MLYAFQVLYADFFQLNAFYRFDLRCTELSIAVRIELSFNIRAEFCIREISRVDRNIRRRLCIDIEKQDRDENCCQHKCCIFQFFHGNPPFSCSVFA